MVAATPSHWGLLFPTDGKRSDLDQVVSVVVTSSQQETPSKELAGSVLTKSARSQLGNDLEWNGAEPL